MRSRVIRLVGGLAVLLSLFGVTSAAQTNEAVETAGAAIELVSQTHDGSPADGVSELVDLGQETWGRALSRTGRFVLFASNASNLVASDANGARDLFLRDRSAATTRLVAAGTGGASAQLADDGGALVFGASHTEELDPGTSCSDVESLDAIFHEDLGSGAITSVTPRSRDADDVCWGSGVLPAISGDGSTVAFLSDDDWHLGQPGDPAGAESLFAFDVGTGTYDLLVAPPETSEQVLPALDLHVDAAGDTVLFTARGPYHPDTPADGSVYAYAHHRGAGTTLLVSRDLGGQPVPVTAADLSADGTHVAFVSGTGPGDASAQAYVHDLDASHSELVGVDGEGAPLEGRIETGSVAISGDGGLVAFTSSRVGERRLFLRDRDAAVTWLVDGVVPTRDFDLSDDGATLALELDGEVEAASLCLPDRTFTTSGVRRRRQGSTCPAGDPELLALEVTQGIQNLQHDVELIPGRRTWVRAHVRSSLGTIEDVGARLRVYRSLPDEGLLGVLTPLDILDLDRNNRPQPGGTIDLIATPDRTDLVSHYAFELPDDWASGILTVEFEGTGRNFACLDGARDCRLSPVVFSATPAPPVEVELARINWIDAAGKTHEPDRTVLARTAHQFRTALPLAELRTTSSFDAVFFAGGDPALDRDVRGVLSAELVAWREQNGCRQPLSDRCYLAAVFVSPTSFTDNTVDGVTPVSFLTETPLDVFYGRGDRQLELTLSHEFGHAAGLEHVYSGSGNPNCNEEPEPHDPYPFAQGQLGTSLNFGFGATGYEPTLAPAATFWGADVWRFTHANGRAFGAEATYDVMTYCTGVWASHVTWQRLRDAFDLRFSPPTGPQAATATGPADLVVSGTIASGTGSIDRVMATDGVAFGTHEDSPLVLRLRDGSGTAVASFGLDGHQDESDRGFVAAVPVSPDVRHLDLLRDGVVLDTVSASGNAPIVTGVTTGASGGEVVLEWTSEDPDGDPLRVRVDYSPDGGTTWLPAAIDVPDTTFTLSNTRLPGSTAARVRVRASDGFWTGEATSEPFALADGAPALVLDVPQPVTYLPGQQVRLDAFVHDPEDGPLDGAAVAWTSDLDGAVGTGASLSLPASAWSFGTHQVVATATDAAGNVATASATVEIAPLTAEIQRLWGDTRIETSVEVSRADFVGDGSASAVVLSRSDVFADALAGAPLAVRADGPLLLTSPDTLTAATEAELVRVLPGGGTVYLLGGTAALSETVEGRVEQLGFETVRLGGRDRYETAVAIATEGQAVPRLLLLADGIGFPDALAAGAAAGALGGAVLLTRGDQLPEATATYLDAQPATARYAVGGPAARADPDAVGLVGPTRYETAALVAAELLPDPLVVGIASGVAFPDALSGGGQAGRLGGPVLLARPTELPSGVTTTLQHRAGRVGSVYVYGGPAALNDAVVDAIAAAVR